MTPSDRVTLDGGGPPLLLLPSMLVLARSYDWLARRLRTRRRVLRLHMPGTADAGPVASPWSFEDYAGHVEAFLDSAGLGPLPVIGHSNSAVPALHLAARRPDLVSHLVLVGPVGGAGPRPMLAVLAGRAFDAILEHRLTLWGFWQPLLNLVRHPRNTLNQVRLAAAADVRPLAARVRIPTLLAWGARDHTMPPAPGLPELRRAIPHAHVYVSAGGSHDWLVDHPAEFAAALERFLSHRPAAPSILPPPRPTAEPGGPACDARPTSRSS